MNLTLDNAMIYVASSWRNPYYESVVKRLKAEGFPVYDFRNPPHGGPGFHWTDVDENAPNWTFEQYAEGLHNPLVSTLTQIIVQELFGCLPKNGYLCTRKSKECKAGSVAQLDRATAF